MSIPQSEPHACAKLPWFCKIGDQELGPMSAAQLQQLAYERKLMPVDLVRRGFGETWTDAARVKGLKFGPGSVLCAPESPSIFKPSDVHKAISPPPKDLVDPPIVSPHQNAPTATAIKVFVNATVSSFGLIWHEGSRVCRVLVVLVSSTFDRVAFWQSTRVAKQRLNTARYSFGKRLYQLGSGPPDMIRLIIDLTNQIEAGKADKPRRLGLIQKRSALILELADAALASDQLSTGAEVQYASARLEAKQLAVLQGKVHARIFPLDWANRSRLIAALSLGMFLGIFCLNSMLKPRAMPAVAAVAPSRSPGNSGGSANDLGQMPDFKPRNRPLEQPPPAVSEHSLRGSPSRDEFVRQNSFTRDIIEPLSVADFLAKTRTAQEDFSDSRPEKGIRCFKETTFTYIFLDDKLSAITYIIPRSTATLTREIAQHTSAFGTPATAIPDQDRARGARQYAAWTVPDLDMRVVMIVFPSGQAQIVVASYASISRMNDAASRTGSF